MESLEIMPVRVRITSILKKAILSGEYSSGQELSLTTIAETLGVSRTPVREAFQTLAAEGLIELRMNRSAVVKNIDEKFVTDHYDMRILLEGEAAARAAVNGMETEGLLTELSRLSDERGVIESQTYTNLNQKLHIAVWKAADNQKLYSFLSILWNGPSVGLANSALDHYRKSTKEHIELLRAIRTGESDKAREIMHRHISRSKDNIIRSFRQSHRG